MGQKIGKFERKNRSKNFLEIDEKLYVRVFLKIFLIKFFCQFFPNFSQLITSPMFLLLFLQICSPINMGGQQHAYNIIVDMTLSFALENTAFWYVR